MPPLCEVDDLKVHFPLRGSAAWLRTLRDGKPPVVRAVDGVSIGIEAGATLGLVGESGCGKSTVARALVRLVRPTAGHIRFEGAELTGLERPGLQRGAAAPADGVPGSRRLAQPAPLGAPHGRGAAETAHARSSAAERKERGPRPCWRKSASAPSWPTAIRTSFRAGSASVSTSPARW